MAVIPQDIIDSIIEAVASDDDSHFLKKCALVSSSFLLPARKHLFSTIYLNSDQGCQRLHQFLVENLVIQSFVRSITMRWGFKISDSYLQSNGTALIAILRLTFCCLESFSVSIWELLDWNNFSSELKDALEIIIHSSTLKTLYLNNVLNMPITMLFQGIHLTELFLDSVQPNNFGGMQSATSEGVAVTTDTVIDQCIWRFTDSVHVLTEPIFLPFMCHLRVFEIYIDPSSATMTDFNILSFLIRSLCISLSSPTATLEHLKFGIVFEGNDNSFAYSSFFDDLRGADVWRHLDSIITHPTGSRLRRVEIGVIYRFRFDEEVEDCDGAEVVQPILDALPLLSEKGILVVETIAY